MKKNSVKLIKAVTVTYNPGGYPHDPRTFKSASQAARCWSDNATMLWLYRKFPMISRNAINAHRYSDLGEARYKRYYEKSYPIFKRMLS